MANGLPILYLGYLELEVRLCGQTFPECGILIVEAPLDDASTLVPGVLGINILRRCSSTLFGEHGPGLVNLLDVTTAPSPVMQPLQRCHHTFLSPPTDKIGKVRLRGKNACCISGGTMHFVPATCFFQSSGSCLLFEPSDQGLPAGLLVPQHWFNLKVVRFTYL